MARIDNLTNFLEDIATSIREKKGTEGTILAENFDKEILSIETGSGGDATSDGNLQAKYLLEGYSAVVDGKLIEGTMKDYGSKTIIATSEDVTIPEGHYDSLLIPIVNASNCIDYTECKEAILSI